MTAADGTKIAERYKVDWATLSEPYVQPDTLNWAIEREKNMQRFARNLIEELSAAEERERVLREALTKLKCNCSSFLPRPCIRCAALATPAQPQTGGSK